MTAHLYIYMVHSGILFALYDQADDSMFNSYLRLYLLNTWNDRLILSTLHFVLFVLYRVQNAY